MNQPENADLWQVLATRMKNGDFRFVYDASGKLIAAQWTNTNIFPLDTRLEEIIGQELFKGNYVLKSTLIGIEMTAK